MIELMLEAERALGSGRLEQAERLYWQAVEADARNAIAVVGLARVALERGDERTAAEFARRALALDPENASALRLDARLSRRPAGDGAAGSAGAAGGDGGTGIRRAGAPGSAGEPR